MFCNEVDTVSRGWLNLAPPGPRELGTLDGSGSPATVAVWFAWWYLRPTQAAQDRNLRSICFRFERCPHVWSGAHPSWGGFGAGFRRARRPVRLGVDVCADPLRVEQDEQFDRAAVGTAQPVR